MLTLTCACMYSKVDVCFDCWLLWIFFPATAKEQDGFPQVLECLGEILVMPVAAHAAGLQVAASSCLNDFVYMVLLFSQKVVVGHALAIMCLFKSSNPRTNSKPSG